MRGALFLFRSRAPALFFATLLGCATEPSSTGRVVEVGDEVDLNGDGKPDGVALDQNGDGVADSVDLDRDGTPDVLLPGAQPPGSDGATGDGSSDGATDDGSGGDGADGQMPDGADPDGSDADGEPADGDDDPPLVIDIPTAEVPCGAASCAIREGNVCCESWTASGFGSESACIEEPACVRSSLIDTEGLYPEYADLFDPNRAVVSRCDGAEDCGVEQICCYVRQGVPLPESLGSTNWIGPGAGRQCMFVEDCLAVAAANGVPTGLLSCNDDGDCAQVDGTSCQPEQDNSPSTGKDVAARDGFMVCR